MARRPSSRGRKSVGIRKSTPRRKGLGLHGVRLVERVRVGAPAGHSARGSARAGISIDDLLSRQLALTAVALPGIGLSVHRHDLEPAVLFCEPPPAAEVRSTGAARPWGEGAWVLDTRAGKAQLYVNGPGLEIVLEGQGGAVVVYDIARPAAEPRLDFAALLGDELLADWLRHDLDRLSATGEVLDLAAAAGLIARLWTPARGALHAHVARENPVERALSWAQNLSASERRMLGARAAAEAQRLARNLRRLDRQLALAPEPAKREAVAWLHRRDDLAGVALLLGDGAPLSATLATLDRAAALHLTAFSAVGAERDPRLAAVAATEPEAWWGALAVGA